MNARAVALHVVSDVFPLAAGAPQRAAQEALDYRLRKADLAPRDRAFATELAYGAIKMRRTLDWYLQPYLGDRAKQLPAAIREILRLAVFELVYTHPDEHATVFEFVNLAKRHGHRGVANLVNAVLRSFLRDRPAAPARENFASGDDYLGTRFSLPTWIVRQWRATFGDRVEAICEGVNAPARTWLSVNTAQTSVSNVRERFANEGVATSVSAFVETSLQVTDGAEARRRESAAAGKWWIQSESSAMAADVLNPQPGEAIVDVCSGRGNKALQVGARLNGDGSLVCIELDPRKAAILGARAEGAGIAPEILIGDATEPLLAPGTRFDRMLLDAPCSGTGILGRHPEARWKKQPSDGERLSRTQRAMLDRLALSVHEGGVLVYAVCSTDPRETSDVVDWFRQHHNFERGLIPARYEPLLNDDGDVLVPPGIEGRDGFFIARLERR